MRELHLLIGNLLIAIIAPGKNITQFGFSYAMTHAYRYTFYYLFVVFSEVGNGLRIHDLFF